MTIPSFIFIICSAGGHVGKTTMARLLGDHFVLSGRRFTGFDTDPYEPEFANRFPRDVAIVKPSSVTSQMALFDGLLVDDGLPKIVDLWHHAISPFFNLWDHISFDAEVRRIGVVPILVFFAEPSQRSLALANSIFAHHPHSLVVTAYNEGAQTTSMIDRETLARFPAGPTFRMPALDPILRNIIDARGFSFSRFMLAPPIGMSIVLRAALKSWILQMNTQFQNLELSLAMESAEFSS
ncbi:MAG TPA: hypothetical protein VIJ06_01045 [Methylovirgula sp.]